MHTAEAADKNSLKKRRRIPLKQWIMDYFTNRVTDDLIMDQLQTVGSFNIDICFVQ